MVKNLAVEDSKPQVSTVGDELSTEQYYTVVINTGEWLGFGGFTYTTAGTVSSPKTR